MMRANRFAAALCLLVLGSASARAVAELNFDELISLVFFEDENAYQDPTGFFCKFIALKDADDFCKVTLTYIDPKLCKVEILRDMRVTWADGRGREFIRSRDVFALGSLVLDGLKEPEVDDAKATSRQNFTTPLNAKWHEGHSYSFALDDSGKYAGCIEKGEQTQLPEADCVAHGQQPFMGTKTFSLLFNSANYNRAMAAIRWLQKNYCTGEPL